MAIITSRGFVDAGSAGRLPTKEGGTIKFGNLKKEAVMGDEGVLGHTEEFSEAPSITVTCADSTALDKEKIKKIVNETIVLSTNNGQQFVLTNAWCSNELELNVKDGTMEIVFVGSELIQQ